REHLLDLIREKVREKEAERDAHDRRTRIGRQEFPERYARNAGGQERRGPQAHHVTRGKDDLDAVTSIRALELLLTGRAQDPADGPPAEHSFPPVMPDPIEGDVPRK